MTKSAPRPAWRGEADGRRPAGEGSGRRARGPLTFILSPLRGARTNSFRTPQSAARTTVSPNDHLDCRDGLMLGGWGGAVGVRGVAFAGGSVGRADGEGVGRQSDPARREEARDREPQLRGHATGG